MRVLVTGVTGFVGSVLARRLVSEGHDVSAFARSSSDRWRIKDIEDDINLYLCDLSYKPDVKLCIKEINPEIIYHFAANQASSCTSSADPDISSNIIGTRHLLDALSTCDYKLFVNAGSSSEYGQKDHPMSECDVLVPNSYHSFTKAAQTLLCQCCALAEGKPIVTLRLFSVYGPHERKSRLIPSVIRGTLNGNNLNLSSPLVVRDFIYVDDVVDVCMEIDSLKKLSGEIINIGTGFQSNIQQVVSTVFELTGMSTPCLWGSNTRSWDTEMWLANTSKSREKLNWTPKHDLYHGLQKTIDWIKDGNL